MAVKIISLMLIAVGIIFISLIFPAPFMSVMNIGIIAGFAIGLAAIALGVFMPIALNHNRKAVKYLYRGVLSAFAVMTLYFAVLSGFMLAAVGNAPEKDSARTVIVHGCQVKKNGPSLMLKERLETAYAYLCENPEAVCIVSGGQGDDEHISEAQAMYDWLTEKGIDGERITKEDKSTSTYENLLYSKELLKAMGKDRRVILVTDGYHQLRASLMARSMGYDVKGLNADTPALLLPAYWVREWFALTYTLIFG